MTNWKNGHYEKFNFHYEMVKHIQRINFELKYSSTFDGIKNVVEIVEHFRKQNEFIHRIKTLDNY